LLGSGRQAWLSDVEQLTRHVRERRAERLEQRGRELAAQRRREWIHGAEPSEELTRALRVELERLAKSGDEPEALGWEVHGEPSRGVPRNARGKPTSEPGPISEWHEVRAKGKRELFTRVESCADELRAVRLTCRGCAESMAIPIGCSVGLFCPRCRNVAAQRFRVDFSRKRIGLTTAARRVGLMDRYRRRSQGGRWGERLLTLTIPHEGGVRDRFQVLSRAWGVFWRALGEALRPRLAKARSGIFRTDPETGEVRYRVKTGRGAQRAREHAGMSDDELSEWDLLSYLWVREWTPGGDGLGHPHLHVWFFSPYLDQAELQRRWAEALASVLYRRTEQRDGRTWVVSDAEHDAPAPFAPVVDVRAAWELERSGSDVTHELVKYLTKEWEVDGDKIARARPEVFAQVFAECDGSRQRQSSAGLAAWAVARHCCCPVCNHTAELGHWARIAVEYVAERDAAKRRLELGETERGPPPRLPGSLPSSAELRKRMFGLHDAAKASGWDPAAVAVVRELEHNIRETERYEQEQAREAERDRAWAESWELRLLRQRMKANAEQASEATRSGKAVCSEATEETRNAD
jgi:hypothetical protein